jgi:RNA polymerase sigma factor (sigma-70 family)
MGPETKMRDDPFDSQPDWRRCQILAITGGFIRATRFARMGSILEQPLRIFLYRARKADFWLDSRRRGHRSKANPRHFAMPPQNSPSARWFSEELQPHETALRAYLLARYPSLRDIDDIVQECLIRVLRVHEREQVISPRGLLFATARNLALDFLRRQQVIAFEPITEIDESSVLSDGASAADVVNQKQELDLLNQAIQSLPERCRHVVILRTIHGFSQRQIAEKLGISENTVEKQLYNGVRRCAEFFARHGLP